MMSFKQNLLQCLGGDWSSPVSIQQPHIRGSRESEKRSLNELQPEIISREEKDEYTIELIKYNSSEVQGAYEEVRAYLLIPRNLTKPAPAICVWHQHNGQYHLGKSEPAGIQGDPNHFTGVHLVKEGFVVICPDAICFEDRQCPKTITISDSALENRKNAGKPKRALEGVEYERYKGMYYFVRGKCLAWKNIFDMKRAIDYVSTRQEVDTERIGCYGHSLGATFSWLIAPFEERIKCVVGNCCMPLYSALEQEYVVHSFSNYIPGLTNYGDIDDIVSLIAPRRLHLNFGAKDKGSPIDFVRGGLDKIKNSYKCSGQADAFSYYIDEEAGHELTEYMLCKLKFVFKETFQE
jgi:dienelactone hydrolase